MICDGNWSLKSPPPPSVTSETLITLQFIIWHGKRGRNGCHASWIKIFLGAPFSCKTSVIWGPYHGQKPSRCLVPRCTPSPLSPRLFLCHYACFLCTMHALFIRIPAQGCHYTEFLCNNGRLSQPAPPFTVSRWEPAGKLFFFCQHIQWDRSALPWLITENEGQCHAQRYKG